MLAGKRILIAALDWGLGHAARCVPIIRRCRQLGVEPVVASSGRALELLKLECPGEHFIELPPYDIRYPYRSMYLNMALQGTKIARVIRREQRQTSHIIKQLGIDAIISDCRFGCFHPGIPSALVNHQTRLPVGGIAGRAATAVLRRWIEPFSETWVPDRPGPDNLSGMLSAGPVPNKKRFIGILSRMDPGPLTGESEVLALLSGPEPQRTALEQLLLPQLEQVKGRVTLVRGLPGDPAETSESGRVEVLTHLEGRALNAALTGARLVICRSGYSSLMDLSALGHRAILIPTPGQGEQEYLGERCRQQGWAGSYAQNGFDLEAAVSAADDFIGFPRQSDEQSLLIQALESLLGY